MNYTLHQLQIFVKVAQTLSVTQAAEELHLTQPAVSIQLKNFQDQFDVPLTEIVGRKIYITRFGQEIARSAAEILDQAESIKQKTLLYKGQLSGTLKISIVSTGKYIMPYFVSGFIKQNPGVDLVIDVTNKAQVVESLTNNEVDFSLVSVLPTRLNIEKLDLLQNKLFLVGNTDRKYNKSPYNKNVFKDLPMIYREKGSGTRQTMEAFIKRNNVPILKKMELTSNEAVKQAILAGLGYSIMPLIGIRSELNSRNLQIVPVNGLPIKTVWRLVWLKGKRHSPAAESFLNYVKTNKDEIVNQFFDWYERY